MGRTTVWNHKTMLSSYGMQRDPFVTVLYDLLFSTTYRQGVTVNPGAGKPGHSTVGKRLTSGESRDDVSTINPILPRLMISESPTKDGGTKFRKERES
jgi:hypothetical protein